MNRKLIPFFALIVLSLFAISFGATQGAQKRARKAKVDGGNQIVISLPWSLRQCESCTPEDGGHGAWRLDPVLEAWWELERFIPGISSDWGDDREYESFKIIARGKDRLKRPTCVIGKKLKSAWHFKEPTARLFLFRNQGNVWITTKIAIRDHN
jgi:hypothetical protein